MFSGIADNRPAIIAVNVDDGELGSVLIQVCFCLALPHKALEVLPVHLLVLHELCCHLVHESQVLV
jgi:hypothetical protein